MKVMAFTDLHEDMASLREIVKKSIKKEADIVVASGDLSIFEHNLDLAARILNSIGKPVLVIPGNHESEKSIIRIAKKYSNIINIHKKVWIKEGIKFFGYGGGGFSYEDRQFRNLIKKKKFSKEDKVVFVTHQPPYGSNLDRLRGSYTGNKDYRRFIKKVKPILVICGHIHENAGKKDFIGKSRVINPGWRGKVVVI